MALLSVLAFGDGSATLFGKRMGGARLPWNPEKSVTGFVAFLLIGLPLTTVMYWGESHNLQAIGPPATFAQSLLISAAGVLAGAVAESVPSRINDNIRVGVAAAIALVLAHAATVGL
jgi:dolichol kinase